jgi:hypothetical protein
MLLTIDEERLVWDAKCQEAFQDIKQYLTKASGNPFILYTRALDHSLGALLAQRRS